MGDPARHPGRPAASVSVATHRIGTHVLDDERGVLTGPDRRPVMLRPKTAEVLRHFARHRGRVVTRDALLSAVWPGVFVTDDSITQCVAEIRKALGPEAQGLLRTLPKRGYVLDDPGAAAAPVPAPHGAPPEQPSIAVLPFRLHGEDAEDRWFAEGVIEGIIHVLSGIGTILVISLGSSRAYAGADQDPQTIGRDLGVRYLLRGTVQRTAGRLRMTAQLLDARDGRVLRSEKLESATDDLFGMQDHLAAQAVHAIAPTVQAHELQQAKRKPPESLTAYDRLLEALDLMPRLQRDLYQQALPLLEDAMRAAPAYAPPRSYAALWHLIRIAQGWSADAGADSASAAEHAAAALERHPGDATALAIQGHMLSYARQDFAAAELTLDRATLVGPSNPLAWTFRSALSSYLGEGERAVQEGERAVRLCPADPFVYLSEHMLARAHYVAGRFDEAERWGRRVMARNPRHAANLRALAASLVAGGQVGAAREVALKLLAESPGFRLSSFAARTPMQGTILEDYVRRLRAAGLPD